jgi:hypothetical protein
MSDPVIEPNPEPNPEPTLEPAPIRRRRGAALVLVLALAVLIVVIAASPFWAPGLVPLLPWGQTNRAPAPQQPDPLAALSARLDRVEATQSGERQAIAAAGNADKASLAQLDQRLRALETKPPPAPPDLSGIQGQIAALSGRIDGLDKTVKAQQSGDPTDAALALVALQIGEAVRAARPFAAEYQAFAALAKNRPEIAAAAAPLGEPATTGVAGRVVLTRELHALAAKIKTVAPPPAQNWHERVVGQLRGLVTIRRIDGTGDSPDEAAIDAAEKALGQGDLAAAVAALGKLSGTNADAAKPWVQMAEARLGVENALHKVTTLLAARLGSATADKPPG